jgi:hypothetical protein
MLDCSLRGFFVFVVLGIYPLIVFYGLRMRPR